jgi:cell pole-organizing protein PopZ
MSSTERAPEPTMEEILASIRRIITDDEAGQAQAQNATPKAQAEEESLEGEADNQIIDDIARVLSGDAPKAPASEEEEILDLAAELGGIEIVEDDGDAVVEVTEVQELDEVIVAGTAPEPQAEQPEAQQPETEQPETEAVVFTALETQESVPEPVAETPQPQEEAPPAQPAQSAGEEAASALERAIAALRAGQASAPTKPFASQAALQPDTTPPAPAEPEPIPMAVPMASPEVEAETHPEPEPVVEPDAELDFEAQPEIAPTLMTEEQLAADELAGELAEEVVLTDAEMTLTEEVAEPESEEKPPFWPVQEEAQAQTDEPTLEPESVFASEPETEAEPVAAPVNGAEAHHDVAGKTLEDSIKDMLRPMLRQWLDENMPRMIREGFDPETLRRRQD